MAENQKTRVSYTFDPDTGLLELTVYFLGKVVLNRVCGGIEAERLLAKIRDIQDKHTQPQG